MVATRCDASHLSRSLFLIRHVFAVKRRNGRPRRVRQSLTALAFIPPTYAAACSSSKISQPLVNTFRRDDCTGLTDADCRHFRKPTLDNLRRRGGFRFRQFRQLAPESLNDMRCHRVETKQTPVFIHERVKLAREQLPPDKFIQSPSAFAPRHRPAV